MSSANIGWLFYKNYFKGLDYKDLKSAKNSDTIKMKVDSIIQSKANIHSEPTLLGSTRFMGSTTYPGLLLGSGNQHELSGLEGQAILGFHFDYASGLPEIQGSSIKGVLRSAFEHPEYIKALLNDDEVDVKALKNSIFNNGDIFFDAVVIGADDNGRIMGDDFITPHEDALKDPKPLRFIKVLPNVSFMFQFELGDGILLKKEKERLFRKILEDLGLGAKTNVGYGKFYIQDAPKTEMEIEQEKQEEKARKEREKEEKEKQEKKAREDKEKKKEEGLSALLECKTLAEGFKLLKDSFGKKPKPSNEEKAIIQKYFNQQKNLSKADKKVFSKYSIS